MFCSVVLEVEYNSERNETKKKLHMIRARCMPYIFDRVMVRDGPDNRSTIGCLPVIERPDINFSIGLRAPYKAGYPVAGYLPKRLAICQINKGSNKNKFVF